MGRPVLALLFTPGVTLTDWYRLGFLDREVTYYRALSREVGPVVFVTEGTHAEEVVARIEGIGLIEDRPHLPRALFWLTVPFRLRRLGGGPRILKTNQLAGVIAPAVGKLLGFRVVARGGYVPSEPWRHPHALAPRRIVATCIEALLCHLADLVLVTSPEAADYLRRRYRLPPVRVEVVPNFVEVERFAVQAPKQRRLIGMVGRLSAEKNVLAAIEAVAGLDDARLRVIGDGPLRDTAQRHATEHGAACEFLGIVPHRDLPRLLAECEVFLLPSLYEGHPKSLIEAMAAALSCVVAPSLGVRSLVAHGVTGYVADDATALGLRRALRTVLDDADLRDRLGSAARRHVAGEFSLQRVVALEREAYRKAGVL